MIQQITPARIALGVGLLALTAAFGIAAQPMAFGAAGAIATAHPRSANTAVVAGNPFSWPADIPAPDQGQGKTKSQGGQQQTNAGHPGNLWVFAGDSPFAIVDGVKDPLYIGSSFDGSTVVDISAAGIQLNDGTFLAAASSGYTANVPQGQPLVGATVPPITQQPSLNSLQQTLPLPTESPSPPQTFSTAYPTMRPFQPQSVPTGSPNP